VAKRNQPRINLDRALRYATAIVTIDGDIAYGPWYVISGEQPRRKPTQSVESAPTFERLVEYSTENELDFVEARGDDAQGLCPGERSLAFRGISAKYAISIARKFGQEALFRVNESSQDVLFVDRGEVLVSREDLSRRRRMLNLRLAEVLNEEFGREFGLPERVRELRGWHRVGGLNYFSGVGDATSPEEVFRTIHDGTESYEPYSVVVNPVNGSVISRVVKPRRLEDDGSDAPLASARIHLDNCANSDLICGLVESTRRIYVWKPSRPYDGCPAELTSIYVGETGLTPEERINRHVLDKHASQWVRDYPDGELCEALMPVVPLPTLATSTAFEEWYGLYLARHGYFVKGGR
jgi:hypothetical protein